MIIKTDQLESEMEAGSSYRDIFKKVNLRRTEICTGVYTVQVFSGIYLIGYGVYFFQRKLYLRKLLPTSFSVI
jgi:MFS transporter, SP family, general alpha glucoside:H+ symporter